MIAPSTLSNSGRNDAGFALPAAVLALVVVAFLVTSGIQMANLESRIGLSTDRSTRAFYVAETGLSQSLADFSPVAAGLDIWGAAQEVNGVVPGGRWSVSVLRVDDQSYYFRSTGAVPAGPNGAEARRTIATLAKVFSVDLNPRAALTTRGNVRVAGSAQIRGADLNPPGWGGDVCTEPLENTPGVITDPGRTVTTAGGASVTGSPAHEIDPDLGEDDFTQFGDVSWEELVALANLVFPGGNINSTGPSLTASGDCNTADVLNWGDPGDPAAPCGRYFPIIYVTGHANIQSGGVGQGILLVEGDVNLRGNFTFNGIIITQGSFNTQGGGPRINGGVMARNADLEESSFVGSSIVNNSRCAVRRAVLENNNLNRMRPVAQRGWVDITGISF